MEQTNENAKPRKGFWYYLSRFSLAIWPLILFVLVYVVIFCGRWVAWALQGGFGPG